MQYSKKELFLSISSNTNMPNQEIFWLLSHILNISQAELIAQPYLILTTAQEENLNLALYEYKELNKPLQYILGKMPFLDIEVHVKPPILIPRPETEEWVNKLILESDYLKTMDANILDMCTGSGVIGLSLAKAFPKSNIILSDINPDACSLAKLNAEANNIYNVTCVVSDLFNNFNDSKMKFDLITINPPYISLEEYKNLDPNVKNWEDIRALVAKDNGLYLIKQFALEAKNWLKNSSKVVMEIGYNQRIDVENIFRELGYKNISCEKDFSGLDRVVKAGME